ncbi:hypothetical protein [Halomarina oriensis]|uniref:Uncharacterized protein n=1 Tax=Halomarina oriensis TaxID=671145 RepID=A0A6B0GMY6_9EURY|nr:hypothetical protein [Halomarina oriensis]MWG34839.1 hypothetical protein [Halomarina oriensis]
MLLDHRFDPKSGAPLASAKEFPTPKGYGPYPGHRLRAHQHGVRTVDEHPLAESSNWVEEREGSLTNGELISAGSGLLGYFRRKHRDVREADPALDRAAALAIKRIKAIDGEGYDGLDTWSALSTPDTYVWYALAERLAAKGHWSTWMLDHCNPRCPHSVEGDEKIVNCAALLKFRPGIDGLEGVCSRHPNDHGTVHGYGESQVRDRVASIYRRAFDEDLEVFRVL